MTGYKWAAEQKGPLTTKHGHAKLSHASHVGKSQRSGGDVRGEDGGMCLLTVPLILETDVGCGCATRYYSADDCTALF